MTHKHGFDSDQWPFDVPTDAPAYSTKNVIKNGYPILTIAHDREGDWQFLCGTIEGPEDMSIVCFGCLFAGHPWIAEFHDLPRGWIAWRENEVAEWNREPLGE